MNDFGQFGGSDEEFTNVRKYQAEVVSLLASDAPPPPLGQPRADAPPQEAEPDNFESWENLIKACEALEGGLSRNSSPQALSAFRDAYDRFLAKFPLFFGYWKKYAELEFNIAGTESAEMVGAPSRIGAHRGAKIASLKVYERGCSCVTHSVDLWTEYCRFKMDTTHDPDVVRG